MLRIAALFTILLLLNVVSALHVPAETFGEPARENELTDDAQRERQLVTPNGELYQHLFSNDNQRPKKNFDEIDNAGFPGFYKKKSSNKRNFDEIDASGFRDFDKKNFDEIDRSGFNDFDKRNFDEIDASGFRGFDKKNLYDRSFYNVDRHFDKYPRLRFADYANVNGVNFVKNFDEMDTAAPLKLKRNFDEIDRSGFPGFNKRF